MKHNKVWGWVLFGTYINLEKDESCIKENRGSQITFDFKWIRTGFWYSKLNKSLYTLNMSIELRAQDSLSHNKILIMTCLSTNF